MPVIPATIIVKFKNDVSRDVVKDYLKKNGMDGVTVSDFMNRWAVDVPPGREEHYSKLLKENDLVDSVCSTTVKGFVPQRREKNEGQKKDIEGSEKKFSDAYIGHEKKTGNSKQTSLRGGK